MGTKPRLSLVQQARLTDEVMNEHDEDDDEKKKKPSFVVVGQGIAKFLLIK